jgi:hypothetical protein
MVRKAGVLRNGRNRFLPMCELRACPCDTSPPDVLPHRAAESASEQLGQVHGMDAGNPSDAGKPVGFHQVRVEIGYTPVEALVRLKYPARVGAPGGFAEQHDRFFHRERIDLVSLLEFAPRAQSCPLDVATHDAAHERRANADPIGEFAPQLRIKFDVERNSASAADLVRVRFLIVKDDRAAAALADMVPRALDKTSAEHVSEEGCGMAVLWEQRPWIVRGFESVQTGLGEDPSNAPGC